MKKETQRKADAAYSTLLAYKTYSGSETEKVEANAKALLIDLMCLSQDYNFTVEDLLREAQEEYKREHGPVPSEAELECNKGMATAAFVPPFKTFFRGPASTPDWSIQDSNGVTVCSFVAPTTRTADQLHDLVQGALKGMTASIASEDSAIEAQPTAWLDGNGGYLTYEPTFEERHKYSPVYAAPAAAALASGNPKLVRQVRINGAAEMIPEEAVEHRRLAAILRDKSAREMSVEQEMSTYREMETKAEELRKLGWNNEQIGANAENMTVPDWKEQVQHGFITGKFGLPQDKQNMVPAATTESEISIRLRSDGVLSDYTAKAKVAHDSSECDELTITLTDTKGDTAGFAVFTVTKEGEPRMLMTAGGNGDGDVDHTWYPLRHGAEAFEIL